MAFSGSQTTGLMPYGVMGVPYAFVAKTFAGVTRVDDRTASGRVIIAFTTGDTFRLRVQRTSGSDNLQTVDEGSAMTVEVIA